MNMRQSFPNCPCSLDYGADDSGWDANGSPVPPPSWRTPPLSGDAQPLPQSPRTEQRNEPHTCWICGRTTPRTLMHNWLLAVVWDGEARQQVRRWVCSSACQMMALLLLNGVLTLERWAA